MTAANSNKRGARTIFASTRFGNVLGSTGSVVPIFRSQIEAGGPVTVTHREMTRFVMSIGEAVKLVLDSAELARGGEVFITKMPVLAITDLARVMIGLLAPRFKRSPADIETIIIGTKPGEKLYEELMNTEEMRRSLELEAYYVVLPAFRGFYHDIEYRYPGTVRDNVERPYNSSKEDLMSDRQIRKLLEENDLLSAADEVRSQRYWPGDKEELSS